MKDYLTPTITVVYVDEDIVTLSIGSDEQGNFGEDIFERG